MVRSMAGGVVLALAILALVGLGYAHPQAAAAVARISAQLGRDAATPALVRAGLVQ